MRRYAFVFLFTCLSMAGECQSQAAGILPLTAIRCFPEGISAGGIAVTTDGGVLLSNRISLNKEVVVRLKTPRGFAAKGNNIFPAAEWAVYSPKGILIFKSPNIFNATEIPGMPAASVKELLIKFILKPEVLGAENSCLVKMRFSDLKSVAQIRLEFPINITRTGEAMQTAKSVNIVKAPANVAGVSVGLKMKEIFSSIDTTIRVNPKMAYCSIEMTKIEGSGNAEILSGKEYFWVYDSKLNEVKISDRQLKQVSGTMEGDIVEYLSKIPFKPKSAPGQYTVRFRWESPDKRKIIDIVVVR